MAMTKREIALRKFVEKYGSKLTGKEVLEAFDDANAHHEVIRDSAANLAAIFADIINEYRELRPGQELDVTTAIRQNPNHDAAAYPSTSRLIYNQLKESPLVEYEKPRPGRYVRAITNGNGKA